MKLPEKTGHNSIVLLSVGLLAGFVIAAMFFVALNGSKQSAHPAIASAASSSPVSEPSHEAAALPSLVATPTPSLTNNWVVTKAEPPQVNHETVLYTGRTPESPGVGYVPTKAIAAMGYPDAPAPEMYSSAPEYVDANAATPMPMLDRNGLIGNPAVDPPSSHGKAYSSSY
jgi:hypothetical protein